MRILLIPPKNNYPDPAPCLNIPGQAFPYLAGALRSRGHQVFGLNMSYKWLYGSPLLALEIMLRKAIEENQPDLIGVGGLSADYRFVRDIIFLSRQIAPEIPIILGGGLVTYDPDYIFRDLKPDFAVLGEGEEVILKLVAHMEQGKGITGIPNVISWQENQPFFTKIDYHYANLDSYAFPDYTAFDFDYYLELTTDYQVDNFLTHTRSHPRILPITLGRSCPFHCTFCSKRANAPYRMRSIDNAIDEIVYFFEKYHFNILIIYDELFSVRRDRILDFCSKILDVKELRGMDFDWMCALRVSQVDSELLSTMKEAGCVRIGYGLESASPRVLKSMKKGTTVDQLRSAIETTKKIGVGVQGNFIMGDPLETEETLKETKLFYDKHCTDLMVVFTYVTPYPGSELFQYCLKNHLIDDLGQYYETIGGPEFRINMTSMADDVFFGLAKQMLQINPEEFRESTVTSCERDSVAMCDKDAPFHLRRTCYRVVATCPHCAQSSEYVYPLDGPIGGMVSHYVTFCSVCHRRHAIKLTERRSECLDIAQYSRPYSRNKSILAPMLSVFWPTIVEAYKDHNMVLYRDKLYAIPQALGPLNMTEWANQNHPEVLSLEPLQHLRTMIDRWESPGGYVRDAARAVRRWVSRLRRSNH